MKFKKKKLTCSLPVVTRRDGYFHLQKKIGNQKTEEQKKIQSEIASQDSEISLAVHVLEIQKDTYLKLACSLNLEMAIKIMKRKEQVTEFPQGLY